MASAWTFNDIESDYLLRTAVTMLAFCLVGMLAAVSCGLMAARTGAAIARDARHDLFERVMNFSPAEVGRFSQASLITRCTNDVQQVQMTLVMFMRMVMLAPITGVVAVIKVVGVHSGLEWTIVAAVLALVGRDGRAVLLHHAEVPSDAASRRPRQPRGS